jgi:hypothetical protein
MHLNSGYQDPLKKTGRIPKSLTIRKLNINKMKINVFECDTLIKSISMRYDSSLYIEFSHVDSANNDRYKVFCDSHNLTLDNSYPKHEASKIILSIKHDYDHGGEVFNLTFAEK